MLGRSDVYEDRTGGDTWLLEAQDSHRGSWDKRQEGHDDIIQVRGAKLIGQLGLLGGALTDKGQGAGQEVSVGVTLPQGSCG